MKWPKNIVLLGAGNVAWHLGRQLLACGYDICHIYNRSAEKAAELASLAGCSYSEQITAIPTDAELYLMAVSDQAITPLAEKLAQHLPADALLLHTSGATPTDTLTPYFERRGVFYPLQTFSRERAIDFAQVPLCLHTRQADDFAAVEALAKNLVTQVYAVSDVQRLQLHLAAVFVNNFTNHLQSISQELVASNGLPAALLQPLLAETVAKLKDLSAQEAQTGPAIRGDQATLDRHLAMLEGQPHWQAVYRLLSKGIGKQGEEG